MSGGNEMQRFFKLFLRSFPYEISAANRRQNAAHAASRGWGSGRVTSPEGAKDWFPDRRKRLHAYDTTNDIGDFTVLPR